MIWVARKGGPLAGPPGCHPGRAAATTRGGIAPRRRRSRPGRVLPHGPPAAVLEGSRPGGMVLIGFPGLAEAGAWYDSPVLQDILRLRTDPVTGDVLLIDGVGPGYDPAERAEKLRAEAEGSAAPARTDPAQAGGPWE
ncbi:MULTISPECIES: DUF1330 domain-containing protein [Streptomyces]|uniref:DUF1330 domain-containing protein n=2 Tax=Streptomyces TaxID=1883 RepID=A0ABU2RVN3_9ACTN|nr:MULTISPECIES: DUF1330 domain-containing protein [unclassified Streptomyces]MDT0431959.1 DUF1330 domain-containing protein [Streptomyces sp. DSM 41770]